MKAQPYKNSFAQSTLLFTPMYVQHAATSIPCRPKICIWILKAGQAPVAVSYAYAAAMPTGLMVVYSGVEHFLKVNFLLMHPLAQGYRDRYDIIDHGHG